MDRARDGGRDGVVVAFLDDLPGAAQVEPGQGVGLCVSGAHQQGSHQEDRRERVPFHRALGLHDRFLLGKE